MAAEGLQTRRRAWLGAVLGLLALLMAAGPGAEQASAAGPCNKWGDKTSNELTIDEARKAVLCLLNRKRRARGISKLDRDRKLQKAAQRHNNYMQNHRCFSHQCSGEPPLGTRLENVGWLTGGLKSWSYGENIVTAAGREGTPEKLVDAWMNSAGHRANILNRTFDEVGVGYSKGTYASKSVIGAIATTDFGFKRG